MVLARSCALTAGSSRLAAGVAAAVAAAAPGHPVGLDGDRVGRSRFVCALAVSTSHAPGLAAVCAHQLGGQLSAGRGALLAALDQLGAAARDELAWHGPRLYPQPGSLPMAGPLGGGRQRPLAD